MIACTQTALSSTSKISTDSAWRKEIVWHESSFRKHNERVIEKKKKIKD